MPLLQLRDIDIYYDRVHAVRGLSLDVDAGEIVALIGANGAGKSTTLNAISGLVRARAGAMRFLDRDITRSHPHRVRGLLPAKDFHECRAPRARRCIRAESDEQRMRTRGHHTQHAGPCLEPDKQGIGALDAFEEQEQLSW